MTTSTHTKSGFVVCVDNSDYRASLELHKIYRTVPDEEAEATGTSGSWTKAERTISTLSSASSPSESLP